MLSVVNPILLPVPLEQDYFSGFDFVFLGALPLHSALLAERLFFLSPSHFLSESDPGTCASITLKPERLGRL